MSHRLITQRKANKKYYLSNKEKFRQRNLDRSKRLALLVFQIKCNNPCACGESDPICLQFHHRDPSQKDFDIANLVKLGCGVERIKSEIAKCDIMCANCHLKLHAKLRVMDSNHRHSASEADVLPLN